MSVSSIAPIPAPTRTGSWIGAVLAGMGGAVRTRRRVVLLVLPVALGVALPALATAWLRRRT